MNSELPRPSSTLFAELEWLNHCFNLRGIQDVPMELRAKKIEEEKLQERLSKAELDVMLEFKTMQDFPLPDHSNSTTPFAELLNSLSLSFAERFVLALALAPHTKPELLDRFLPSGGNQTARGGVIGKGSHAGFMATGQTALFLFADNNPARRAEIQQVFHPDHPFRKRHLLWLETVPNGDPKMNGRILLSQEIIDLATLGYVFPPDLSSDFPAKRITTGMDWDDLVLSPLTLRQVEEVKLWVKHQDRLMNELGLGKRIKPGNKILFYGPPGTGKTLTAQLLGKYIRKEVYRIDLSSVVNKYVGETEKNLSKIFDKAEHANWILFFDEADALFGARSKTNSANDRFANQQVSYLLQRIEEYAGIVILASNMKNNIDEAFMRRFQSVVHFPFPKADERQLLWKKAFPEKIILTADVDLRKVADKYEMSGAQITNIATWCSLMALEKEDYQVSDALLREGLARELAKEGRTL